MALTSALFGCAPKWLSNIPRNKFLLVSLRTGKRNRCPWEAKYRRSKDVRGAEDGRERCLKPAELRMTNAMILFW